MYTPKELRYDLLESDLSISDILEKCGGKYPEEEEEEPSELSIIRVFVGDGAALPVFRVYKQILLPDEQKAFLMACQQKKLGEIANVLGLKFSETAMLLGRVNRKFGDAKEKIHEYLQ